MGLFKAQPVVQVNYLHELVVFFPSYPAQTQSLPWEHHARDNVCGNSKRIMP